jgi:hypothetical protein
VEPIRQSKAKAVLGPSNQSVKAVSIRLRSTTPIARVSIVDAESSCEVC